MHRRIADEYCGGAAVTKFPTKYFRINYAYCGIYNSMQISIIYHCIEMCKYTKTMKMKNNLMRIVCHSRVGYVL